MMLSDPSLPTKALSGLGDSNIAEMSEDLVKVHDVHMLVGKIKQIRLQRNIRIEVPATLLARADEVVE
jgi:hypothetical protein